METEEMEEMEIDLTEKTLRSETIFEGKILHVRQDTVELPNGRTATREVLDHPGGVCVLALDRAGRVLLVRQFRYPYEKTLLELPAGKLERGEDPYAAAMRELQEETGASTPTLQSLGDLYPSPGYCGEIIHMYLAQELDFGAAHPDEDEFLAVERVPMDELVDWILAGTIRDAKTIAAVLKAKLLLDR